MQSHNINKFLGFYELKESDLPHVKWQIFEARTKLNSNRLWTIRMALKSGNDFSLPRYVGVTSDIAIARAKEMLGAYGDNGVVIYYPYFVAIKSGTLLVEKESILIEAVYGDLWRLVDENILDARIAFIDSQETARHNTQFFTKEELAVLLENANKIRRKYRYLILQDKSIVAEWSFAKDANLKGKPIGDVSLVFYELRSI